MAAATASSGSSSSSSSSSSQGQEFIVRIPKQTKKRYHVMRFNAAHKQDISKWTQVRMERENNMKEFKLEDDMPKFGAGSEFGRDQKEEARRKKYGIIMKKYNPDDQPWLLRVGGKGGKRFKAIREGGVSENTSFYVFCKAPDGVFEAFPIEEWYNFNPVNRFKALTAEEAEVEFERRDKVMNHFSIMVRKKMSLEEEGAKEEGEEEKGKKGKKGKKEKNRDFQLTEMDDWLSDSDGEGDDDSDGERDDDDGGGKKKKKKGKAGEDDKKKKKKKNQSDEEAMEESDEGDFDDREVDYMSESSSEEEEPADEKANRELKGVEDEDALRAADQSDEEEEGEKEEEKPEGEEEATKDEKSAEPKPKSKADKKEGGSSKSASKGNSSGESSSESSDSDFDDSKFQSAMFMQSSARQKPKKKNGCESANSSRANTPTKHVSDEKKGKGHGSVVQEPWDSGSSKALKRKIMEESPSAGKTDGSAPKRPRSESNLPSTPSMPSSWSSSTEGITEESVRRYLLRKPMTTTELLQKFKSKKTGMSSEKLVNTIAQILKRLNPEKQTIKGKLYLSIKP
ncbi:general transcription factor IIF subunit 1-like isoform X2 [Dermacentor andersoni]|uniref:general transcription factor IIF subunit 1-like isoform X2 n=1 Tax=Dermacentor andersoni TaxID=34620 RepID=UPI003B3A6DDE